MIKYLISISLFATFSAYTQTEIENEVTEQVWKPFKKAWEARDAEAYNALHTDDVFRVTENGIRVGKEYKDANIERFSQYREQKRSIDFWMEHRIYNGDHGYEVGYFRITAHRVDSDPQYYYGRFHIRLRKENGVWKIAQDWDTSSINGVEITGEDFDKGTLLDL